MTLFLDCPAPPAYLTLGGIADDLGGRGRAGSVLIGADGQPGSGKRRLQPGRKAVPPSFVLFLIHATQPRLPCQTVTSRIQQRLVIPVGEQIQSCRR
jgi:hypothetical protein